MYCPSENLVVGILKHICHQPRQFSVTVIRCGLSTNQHTARGRFEKAIEVFGQCRLTGAVLAKDGDEFAISDVQVNPSQCLHMICGIDVTQPFSFKDGRPFAIA